MGGRAPIHAASAKLRGFYKVTLALIMSRGWGTSPNIHGFHIFTKVSVQNPYGYRGIPVHLIRTDIFSAFYSFGIVLYWCNITQTNKTNLFRELQQVFCKACLLYPVINLLSVDLYSHHRWLSILIHAVMAI